MVPLGGCRSLPPEIFVVPAVVDPELNRATLAVDDPFRGWRNHVEAQHLVDFVSCYLRSIAFVGSVAGRWNRFPDCPQLDLTLFQVHPLDRCDRPPKLLQRHNLRNLEELFELCTKARPYPSGNRPCDSVGQKSKGLWIRRGSRQGLLENLPACTKIPRRA